jgi:hypothetical protein
VTKTENSHLTTPHTALKLKTSKNNEKTKWQQSAR